MEEGLLESCEELETRYWNPGGEGLELWERMEMPSGNESGLRSE